MADISRLSPYNIKDDLLRADLYREIRNNQKAQDGWIEYTIQPDEILRPELAAFRFYGIDGGCKWVVLVAAGLDDMREQLTAGITVYLPTTTWLRQRILHYMEREEALAA